MTTDNERLPTSMDLGEEMPETEMPETEIREMPVDAAKTEALVHELQELQGKLHWLDDADWFRSTINDNVWYVSDKKTARLATEVGAAGPRDAALVAKLLKNLPLILTALSAHGKD